MAEAGGRIVAHYYDVESGTGTLAAWGALAGFAISIPRDGGLHELLISSALRPRAFDRVIVESISRLSRNSSVAFRVEDDLRAAGVRLCCADEPLEESFGTIVLRHVNIGIARGYHHELMVKSRQGLETWTRQGWHTGGIAAYGYRFVEHDHPNPHKAARVSASAHWSPTPFEPRWLSTSTTSTYPAAWASPRSVTPSTSIRTATRHRSRWIPPARSGRGADRASGRCSGTPSTPVIRC
ncbi:MAG TPA: recombinase family protein [Actinomycetota bacterium]|nr:recombinase family protein [Actinomycetota bacterium]